MINGPKYWRTFVGLRKESTYAQVGISPDRIRIAVAGSPALSQSAGRGGLGVEGALAARFDHSRAAIYAGSAEQHPCEPAVDLQTPAQLSSRRRTPTIRWCPSIACMHTAALGTRHDAHRCAQWPAGMLARDAHRV